MATNHRTNATPEQPTSVAFESLDAARAFREQHSDALADRDRGNEKTVRLRPGAERETRREADRAALRSGADEHLKTDADPSILTDAEKDRLKSRDGFSWQQHAFEAAKAKSRAEAAGARDWMDFYEPNEGAGGVLDRIERQKKMQARTGAQTALTGDCFEAEASKMQEGRKAAKARGDRETRAREAARDGVEEAIEELIDVFGYEPSEARALAEPEPTPEVEPDEPVVSANEPEPEPTPEPEPEPVEAPDVSVARGVAAAVADTGRELARGARTFGAAVRFAATGD